MPSDLGFGTVSEHFRVLWGALPLPGGRHISAPLLTGSHCWLRQGLPLVLLFGSGHPWVLRGYPRAVLWLGPDCAGEGVWGGRADQVASRCGTQGLQHPGARPWSPVRLIQASCKWRCRLGPRHVEPGPGWPLGPF